MASTEPKPQPLTRRPAGDWRNPTPHELNWELCPKAWAWHMRGREISGDPLSYVQRQFWREALQEDLK